jgi:hypothetical protein
MEKNTSVTDKKVKKLMEQWKGKKRGDDLTIDAEIISNSGRITFNKGDKVTIAALEIKPGHYYRTLPDIWVPSKLQWVKLIETPGTVWNPETFKEFKEEN